MIAILLALQAAASLPLPPSVDPLAAAPLRCVPDGDEITVCGRRDDDYRIGPIEPPPRAITGPPDSPLSFRLPGGGTGRVHAIQSEIGGAKGQGAAVTLRIPF